MSSVCTAKEEEDEEIISLALLACRCHRALMIEMLERWVHLHLPSSRQSRKRKKNEKRLIKHSPLFVFSGCTSLFIIQSCPLLINNMPIVVSSAHLASALTHPTLISAPVLDSASYAEEKQISLSLLSSSSLVRCWLMSENDLGQATNGNDRASENERENSRSVVKKNCFSSPLFSNKHTRRGRTNLNTLSRLRVYVFAVCRICKRLITYVSNLSGLVSSCYCSLIINGINILFQKHRYREIYCLVPVSFVVVIIIIVIIIIISRFSCWYCIQQTIEIKQICIYLSMFIKTAPVE